MKRFYIFFVREKNLHFLPVVRFRLVHHRKRRSRRRRRGRRKSDRSFQSDRWRHAAFKAKESESFAQSKVRGCRRVRLETVTKGARVRVFKRRLHASGTTKRLEDCSIGLGPAAAAVGVPVMRVEWEEEEETRRRRSRCWL